ncbi:NIPSNAP family protein [bacterium]|nr:NIPSNAP family containing protein [Gemmatimonadota bacterium]MCH2663029.1 NIPSNAP family protein [bacterium]
MAFFELRQYRIKDGRMNEWVEFMETEIIPYQVSKGMVVVGSFVAEEEEDLYIWIRRFENEEEREKLYEAVYQDPDWTDGISDRVGEIMDREQIVVTRILPTSRSVLQ